MKLTSLILTFWIMAANALISQEQHSQFTQILQSYVEHGRVNYNELCEDVRLQGYIKRLSRTNPDTITDDKARLAFWLNAYNAFTLKVICEHYPLKSINELHFGGLYIGSLLKKTIWDKKFIVINNNEMSLNDIEHGIVRAVFKDPRAHFALVCASKSCPTLRSEAYEADKLEEQLDEQGRIFFSESDKNFFTIEKKQAQLSKILDWYADDFGNNDEEILLYVARFLPDELAAAIKANPGKWSIKHTKYDWSLNE
ncbi:MAG: DUF547 domain-containing protein [bacterium]